MRYALEVVQTLLAALLPLFALIALGYLLRQKQFVPDGFWPGLDKLNYWVLFPCLLFLNLAVANLNSLDALRMAAVMWGALLATAGLLLLTSRWLAPNPAAFSSVFQGGIRFNSYVALGTLPVLFAQGGAIAATLVALVVPVVNLLCVGVMSRMASAGSGGFWFSLVTNPLILACVGGALWNGLSWPLGLLEAPLKALAQASLACGLLSVGAGLRFAGLQQPRPLMGAALFKFAVLPAFTLLGCWWWGVPQPIAAAMVFFHALPTASASYALARQMGGDHSLMALILSLQTVVAFAVLPLWWLLLP